ncbi:MAG: hypothetical protein JSV26_03730 [bacterium]|nr:MAG: hypothetical protein JSV26_03730 [bacterium]
MIRSVLWGFTAGGTLAALYFIVLSLSNSLQHALEELRALWFWLLPLITGFGVQAGLYFFIRGTIKQRAERSATASVVASGGTSTAAMVACCMHHVTDILPIFGTSAAALFLARYQTVFLALGVASNVVGIIMMLRIIQQKGLYGENNRILVQIMRLDMGKVFFVAVLAGTAFIGSIVSLA